MSHSFQRMKTTNYGRCHMCDTYVYFWGCECNQCQLICHKKCLKKLTIMCPHAPLGPKCSILNKDIESLPEDEMVPILVRKCTEEIERRSLKRPGIYRMSGVATRVEKLLKSFESGPHLIDLIDVSTNDITSVLKIFLRELKEPLVPNSIYKLYIDVGRVFRHEGTLKDDAYVLTGDAEHSELIRQMRLCVSKLTPHRLATMRHMFGHLNRIAAYSSQNHMTPAAIGIIFAPTLFRP
ncbi:PREDICTED: minor histocompatibility protein HA-1-like, partial [Rhagoletis zephyria]|uniref:minor histocompatibility protein HA-1-like n=1 Tax=Rhagoletis zephyria TaxID=28612 RepID=UPI000811A790